MGVREREGEGEGEKEKKRREVTPEGQGGRWWWNAGEKCSREVEKVR